MRLLKRLDRRRLTGPAMARASIIGIACSCAASCTTEDFAPPKVAVAPAYRQAISTTAPAPIRTDWWRGFHSSELTRLIEAARTDNLDIAAAVARIQQADAAARIAGAPLLPTVDGSANVTRSRGAGFASGRVGQGTTVYGLSASASYELDFWGKNRAAAVAAQETALARRYDRQTVELTSIASAANTYFDLLGAQERLSIARENVRNASLVLATIQQRVQAGTATALDLAEQQSLLAQQRASIPPLEQTIGQDQAALAVLVGQPPASVTVKGGSINAVAVPKVAPGLPSALLTRRPDISYAEANLASADANVTVARAQFFPSIQLTGQAGLENSALKSLFEPTSTFYSLAAGLTQPIFEGGKLKGQLEQAKGVQAELVADYRKAVVSAFSDVESALVAVRQLTRQEALLGDAVASARKAYGLTEQQLEQGTVDITTVLTNQTTLYQTQSSLVQVRVARLQAVVALYQALGGGWEQAEIVAATEGAK